MDSSDLDQPETMLEIVKLESGDYVMRKAGEKTPLMTLNISEKVKTNLSGKSEELARLMLVAGAQIMSDLSEGAEEASELPMPSVIH